MLKQKIKKFVQDIEIDPTTLDSCEWDSNPYLVESQLAGGSGEYVWDEAEEWEAKKEAAIEAIKCNGLWGFVPEAIDERDAETLRLTDAIIEYIEIL